MSGDLATSVYHASAKVCYHNSLYKKEQLPISRREMYIPALFSKYYLTSLP